MTEFITNWMPEIALGFLYALFTIKIYNYVSKYYSTPQSTWVGLTPEEYPDVRYQRETYYAGIKWAEDRLREKNT